MVHSYNSSEIQQVDSRNYSPYSSYPSHSVPPMKDCREVLEEIFTLETVSEQISRVDDRIKELEERMMRLDAARAKLKEELMEDFRKIDEEEERRNTELLRNIEALKKLLLHSKL
ncbi:PREDICTED: uncharacterized protein LOC104784015 [Camelina sativa]|uniref:Uncharacterized protein LOC104784015 n=1 Tax=Camelina sativa TaxID=90675 RepID=A0ABM0YXE9_CAMSA|nr:PREDICTED: uncharacterized protein LOC104784015 [Camelina sativa]